MSESTHKLKIEQSSKKSFPFLTVIIGVLLLVGSYFIVQYFKNNQPSAQKGPPAEQVQAKLSVDVEELEPRSYQSKVNAYGQVEALTRGQIVSQVSGEILSVHENSAEGAIFSKGDELIKIDDKDYKIALTSSKAMLASAESTLLQEKARSEQAVIDWERLGNGNKANDLVLRKPQLLSAQSDVESAKSTIEQAELDISRTSIKAPYDGQVIGRLVDFGQFVSQGEPLLEIYSLDRAEVKLPLNSYQLGLLDLNNPQSHKVDINVSYGSETHQWQAVIERLGAAFDESSRQLSAIAIVENPFVSTTDKPALRLGQFVDAEIKGKSFDNVYVIPSENIYQNQYVLVVENGVLTRKDINIIYQDDKVTLTPVSDDLKDLVVTKLSSSQIGLAVNIKGQKDTTLETSKEPRRESAEKDRQKKTTGNKPEAK